jgi:tRNA modification GTPase
MACQVYVWPDRRSYTGQPVAEMHLIGSPPLLEATLAAVCQAGARLAEPGEFTLRAFLAGRIDLTQAEAVLGVIDATDRQQLDVALEQLAGGLAHPLSELRRDLVSLLADLEAGLDFPEEDISFVDSQELARRVDEALRAVRGMLAQMQSRAEPQQAAKAILLGAPNAGKSSLFNALTGRAAALVWHEPGTTRDYLVADIDLQGVACRLVDTAGVEPEHIHEIDRSAQTLAADQARGGQLRIFCIDSTRPLNAWEREQLAAADPQRILVLTKIDRATPSDRPEHAIRTSSATGEGLDVLRRRLREAIAASADLGVVASTASRCRQSLERAAESLAQAGQLVRLGEGEELVAAELRVALAELGRVAGEVYTDDVLELVFSRFCIGK